MYHVRAAKIEDIYQIVNEKGFTFDLNIEFKPKFYILLEDEKMVSFAFVNFCDEYAIIENIDTDGLNEDEFDFFIKSLNYVLTTTHKKVFTRVYYENYTIRTSKEDLFVLNIKSCNDCRHA